MLFEKRRNALVAPARRNYRSRPTVEGLENRRLLSDAPFLFRTVDYPGAPSTRLDAINDSGQIMGLAPGIGSLSAGFLWSEKTDSFEKIGLDFNTFFFLNATAYDINNAGQILISARGDESLTQSYVKTGSNFVQIEKYSDNRNENVDISGYAINDSGLVFGDHIDFGSSDIPSSGFLWSQGSFSGFEFPVEVSFNAPLDGEAGINNAGQMVASYVDSGGKFHGFLLDGGVLTTLDVDAEGATFTSAHDINDAGQIVGSYRDAGGRTRGFLLSEGRYTTLDFDDQVTSTVVRGINNAGQVVGSYRDAGGRTHGFFATPRPDIGVESIVWNTVSGGVDLRYEVDGGVLDPGGTIELYWSTGPGFGSRIGGPAFSTPAEAQEGPHDLHVSAARVAVPPADATHLLLVTRLDTSQAPDADDILELGTPLEIVPFQQTIYDLLAEPVPAMPEITARARFVNLDSNPVHTTTFRWQAKIRFDASTALNGPKRRLDHDYPIQEVTGTRKYMPDFQDGNRQVIRGGDLSFIVKASIAGFDFEARSDAITSDDSDILKVRGLNPSEAVVRAYVRQRANALGIGDHVNDLGRIIRHESSYRQFRGDHLNRPPLFSADKEGGVGLYQITNPKPTPDQIWEWTSNVNAGLMKFKETLSLSKRLHVIVQGPVFRQSVQQVNAYRISQGLPAIALTQVYVPPLSTEQIRLNAIRGFNGYAGTDERLGGPLYEYTLAFDAAGRLGLTFNANTNRWETRWVRVPVARRPQTIGDPNYVENVIGQDP